jgi:hypothetical protein
MKTLLTQAWRKFYRKKGAYYYGFYFTFAPACGGETTA